MYTHASFLFTFHHKYWSMDSNAFCPFKRQPRQGKGTSQMLLRLFPLFTLFWLCTLHIDRLLMPFPSLSSHGLLFLGRLLTPPCIQSRPVLLKRLLLHHFFFPHPLTQQVLTAHFGPVFFGQIVVPLFSHRGFVCLERFVLSRGLETSNPLMIESVVEGLGVLHPVHGRFFPFLYCRCCSIFLARGSMV